MGKSPLFSDWYNYHKCDKSNISEIQSNIDCWKIHKYGKCDIFWILSQLRESEKVTCRNISNMIFLDLLQQSKVPRRGTGLKQRSEPLGAPKHHQQQQQQQTEQKFSMDQGQHNKQNRSHEGTTALTSSQHQPSTTNIHQHQPASINHYNSKSNHYNSNPTHESRKKHLLMKLTQFYFISLCLAGSTQ